MNKYKIIALLFVKNGEIFIKQYLDSVLKFVDGIIIYNDNSTDNTLKIIEKYKTNKILELETVIEQQFNELNIRQQLLSLSSKYNPEWLLCLDVDEFIDEIKFIQLYSELDIIKEDTIGMPMVHLWDNESKYKSSSPHDVWFKNDRLFKNKKIYKYSTEQTAHISPVPYTINSTLYTNILLKHYGYFTKEMRLKKYNFWKQFDSENKLTWIKYEDLFIPQSIILRDIDDIDYTTYYNCIKNLKYKEY